MKRIVVAVIVFLLVAFAAASGIAWYYAGEIEREALATERPPAVYDLVVSEVGNGAITLEPAEAADRDQGDWLRDGQFGILTPDGGGAIGKILETDGGLVTRELLFFNSAIAKGDAVRLQPSLAGDPLKAHGLAFEEVEFESDIGRLGAWYLHGSSDTWAIFVHGRAADRSESLAVLPVLAALGMPTLVIQYRNDDGVAGSASGFYDFGQSEWRDLEAVVGYAVDHGAKDVVPIGYSMGGAIAVSFLYRSERADRVRGIVLESPTLDFGDVIDFGAERRNLWSPVTRLGKIASTLRSGVSWDELDYLARADELAVPILLIHGDDDQTVHIRTSDELAERRSDLVTYLRLDDVDHVRGWNVEQEVFERALTDFLTETLAITPVGDAGVAGSEDPK